MAVNPLKSHLFWFLSIGASIFLIDALLSDRQDEIVIDEAVTARIASLWQLQMKRAPVQEELDALVADWIVEEMLYREAKRLRLDEDDLIIRRRLVQKISFMAEEPQLEEPDDEMLRAYFSEHAAKYRLPTRYTFSQVFFRNRDAEQQLRAELKQSDPDWRSLSEASMFNPSYVLRNSNEIQSDFGGLFVESLQGLEAKHDWQGPMQSEFGWHLIKLEEKHLPEMPSFRAVRRLVLNDYLYEARAAAKRSYLSELRQDYKVIWQLTEDE